MASVINQLLLSAPHNLWRLWTEIAREVQAMRGRWKAAEELRNERGITLLREWLSREQNAQFAAFGHFDVIGCDTGSRYRICPGTQANVHELDAAGQPVMGWCFVPSGSLVMGDVMLAQKIALETNERNALSIANRFSVGARTSPSLISSA